MLPLPPETWAGRRHFPFLLRGRCPAVRHLLRAATPPAGRLGRGQRRAALPAAMATERPPPTGLFPWRRMEARCHRRGPGRRASCLCACPRPLLLLAEAKQSCIHKQSKISLCSQLPVGGQRFRRFQESIASSLLQLFTKIGNIRTRGSGLS